MNGYTFPMSFTLLDRDEETDMGVYRAYLRTQSDTDLLDITRHLDAESYPARNDAAGRELRRRGLLQTNAYTPAEYAVRHVGLLALALALVTFTLTRLLTPTDAAGPSWPTGEMLPDGTPMPEVARLFTVAILRGFVVWSSRFGLTLILLVYLGGWVVTQARSVWKRRARPEVWRLTLLGFAALCLALCLAAGPSSAVPTVFGPPSNVVPGNVVSGWERALPLWDPFAAFPPNP